MSVTWEKKAIPILFGKLYGTLADLRQFYKDNPNLRSGRKVEADDE